LNGIGARVVAAAVLEAIAVEFDDTFFVVRVYLAF